MVFFAFMLFVIYLVYTLHFAIQFNKTDTYFSNNQTIVHNILIWLIPFFWIIILKTLIRPTPGSSKFKKRKSDAGFYESGIGIWGHGDADVHDGDGGNGGGDD